MLADDDMAILDSVKILLEDEGYEVDAVSSGAKVRSLNADLPAVLILDIWLAGEDGREICKVLKHQEETKNLPIILFSANQDVQHIAQEVGADDFLFKPFDIDDLLDKVQRYM